MLHQPTAAFEPALRAPSTANPLEVETDRHLISLCKAAEKALHHEAEIYGGAVDLMCKVELDMPPPKRCSSFAGNRTSAADARDAMRNMRAQKGGYNKTTYNEYRQHLPVLVEHERACEAEFRKRGGHLLRRREAASAKRCNTLMSEICTTPARTALGLSYKCSLIWPWHRAGFGITAQTQLIRSIADNQFAICHGFSTARAKPEPEPDQALILLAYAAERHLKQNENAWYALAAPRDEQVALTRANKPIPPELRRKLLLADIREKITSGIMQKDLYALADWPALTKNGYVAKLSVLNAYQRCAIGKHAGDALSASLRRDFDNLEERRQRGAKPSPGQKPSAQVH